MPNSPTQDHRAGVLTTPLGKDALVLVRFDCEEAISELFEFRVEALSEKPDIDFEGAIGGDCSITYETFDGEKREFNGVLAEAQWVGVENHLFSYQLVLRPWLWLLSHRTDCRIFRGDEGDTVPKIIEAVFEKAGFSDYEFRLGQYEPVEYCVQYRETDFNFVSRLMEKEGIYYFFEHNGGKHKMVMVDDKTRHRSVPNHDKIPFRPLVGTFNPKEQRIEDWISGRRFRTGKVTLNDYDYEKPKVSLLSDAKATQGYAHSDMEIYDYPGNYKKPSEGDRYAKIELEAEQAQDYRRQGSGEAPSLCAGAKVTLKDHPADGQNVEYLITRAVHSYGDQTYLTTSSGDEGASYSGRYEFMPNSRQYRAMLVTPKPRIYGIQTAVVVNKAQGGGDEIDVEQLTEIYVSFYWDRKDRDPKRSCKIRVAQMWSGKNWGGQFIPRVGQEVVVEFLEGDPDRPLIVGTVYNDDYRPPYDLPSQKTIAGVKSDSTNGGNGYNELNFDDKKYSEKITLHAEKDHDGTVKHSETWTIGETFEIPMGSPSRQVTIKMGDDELKVASGNRKVDVAINDELKAGMQIKQEAGLMIQLECGASKITMTPASIEIQAPLISLSGVMVKIN